MTFMLHKLLNLGTLVWIVLSPVFIERMKLVSRGMPAGSTQLATFSGDDRTIYCWLLLSKPALYTRVKFEWKAISVEGIELGRTLLVTEYTTKLAQRFAQGGFHCSRSWPSGQYRVAVYLNGVRARAMDYTVVKPGLVE